MNSNNRSTRYKKIVSMEGGTFRPGDVRMRLQLETALKELAKENGYGPNAPALAAEEKCADALSCGLNSCLGVTGGNFCAPVSETAKWNGYHKVAMAANTVGLVGKAAVNPVGTLIGLLVGGIINKGLSKLGFKDRIESLLTSIPKGPTRNFFNRLHETGTLQRLILSGSLAAFSHLHNQPDSAREVHALGTLITDLDPHNQQVAHYQEHGGVVNQQPHALDGTHKDIAGVTTDSSSDHPHALERREAPTVLATNDVVVVSHTDTISPETAGLLVNSNGALFTRAQEQVVDAKADIASYMISPDALKTHLASIFHIASPDSVTIGSSSDPADPNFSYSDAQNAVSTFVNTQACIDKSTLSLSVEDLTRIIFYDAKHGVSIREYVSQHEAELGFSGPELHPFTAGTHTGDVDPNQFQLTSGFVKELASQYSQPAATLWYAFAKAQGIEADAQGNIELTAHQAAALQDQITAILRAPDRGYSESDIADLRTTALMPENRFDDCGLELSVVVKPGDTGSSSGGKDAALGGIIAGGAIGGILLIATVIAYRKYAGNVSRADGVAAAGMRAELAARRQQRDDGMLPVTAGLRVISESSLQRSEEHDVDPRWSDNYVPGAVHEVHDGDQVSTHNTGDK